MSERTKFNATIQAIVSEAVKYAENTLLVTKSSGRKAFDYNQLKDTKILEEFTRKFMAVWEVNEKNFKKYLKKITKDDEQAEKICSDVTKYLHLKIRTQLRGNSFSKININDKLKNIIIKRVNDKIRK